MEVREAVNTMESGRRIFTMAVASSYQKKESMTVNGVLAKKEVRA